MSLDIHPERSGYDPDPRPVRKSGLTILSLFIWLGLVAAFGMFIVGLSGCAAKPEIRAEVCYLKFLGNTEQGHTVVMQACQSPEKFQASQR